MKWVGAAPFILHPSSLILPTMNGIHDLGGMHGFGAVEREADEPPFHAPWEATMVAIQNAVCNTEINTEELDARTAFFEEHEAAPATAALAGAPAPARHWRGGGVIREPAPPRF